MFKQIIITSFIWLSFCQFCKRSYYGWVNMETSSKCK